MTAGTTRIAILMTIAAGIIIRMTRWEALQAALRTLLLRYVLQLPYLFARRKRIDEPSSWKPRKKKPISNCSTGSVMIKVLRREVS
jgi:hypothetical protein